MAESAEVIPAAEVTPGTEIRGDLLDSAGKVNMLPPSGLGGTNQSLPEELQDGNELVAVVPLRIQL